MRVRWLSVSERDLIRLHAFLKEVNPRAAARTVQSLIAAAEKLPDYPHLGKARDGYEARDVRSILVGDYELRYEITAEAIVVLRIWHTREDR